jgi:hypothetical protein
MSTNGRPSMAKRQKEMARQEKQREKTVKRVQRATERENGTGSADEAMEVVFDAEGNPVRDEEGNLMLVPVAATPAAAKAG